MSLLLKGGRVVDPAVGLNAECDVLVVGERIEAVGAGLSAPKGASVIDCMGKMVVPGLVDPHVHLREPGLEYKETVASGTRAAAHGGFTAIAAMPNTKPVCDEGSAVRFLLERAAAQGVVRVHAVGACTVGLEGEALAEIGDMVAEGAVAITDDGRGIQDAGMMRKVMDYTKAFGISVMSHCQDEALSGKGVVNEGVVSTRLGLPGMPAAAEEVQVARDIRLAALTGCKLHLQHLSTAGSVELIRAAKAAGVPVTCEVTPHHLFLTEDDLTAEYDTAFKMNPPLRSADDRDALVSALLDGTVDCVATDHAPHAPHEKALEFELAPFGTTGLETALPLVLTHLVGEAGMSWETLVERMSHAPRRILGVEPVTMASGSFADITVIDPQGRVEVGEGYFQSASRNSAFIGAELRGCATQVLVGGRVVLEDGQVVA